MISGMSFLGLMQVFFKNHAIKDIIIKAMLGMHADSDMYTVVKDKFLNENENGQVNQIVLYQPCIKVNHTEYPSIVTVIEEEKVDTNYMRELIRLITTYCSNDDIEPIVLIFSGKGIAEDMEPFLNKANTLFLHSLQGCNFWAKRCLIVTGESLDSYVDPNDMKKGNAFFLLAHFLLSSDRENDSPDRDSPASIEYFDKIIRDVIVRGIKNMMKANISYV